MAQVNLVIRDATAADLSSVVRMLADDVLGATREKRSGGVDACYRRAFEAIDADPRNRLIVAERDGALVGTFQLTFIPSLTFEGGERAQIEAVRVDSSVRGQGVGRIMFEWAIEEARRRGCRMVQLTTNRQRSDALRFYESLGFAATHDGLKLYL